MFQFFIYKYEAIALTLVDLIILSRSDATSRAQPGVQEMAWALIVRCIRKKKPPTEKNLCFQSQEGKLSSRTQIIFYQEGPTPGAPKIGGGI